MAITPHILQTKIRDVVLAYGNTSLAFHYGYISDIIKNDFSIDKMLENEIK